MCVIEVFQTVIAVYLLHEIKMNIISHMGPPFHCKNAWQFNKTAKSHHHVHCIVVGIALQMKVTTVVVNKKLSTNFLVEDDVL